MQTLCCILLYFVVIFVYNCNCHAAEVLLKVVTLWVTGVYLNGNRESEGVTTSNSVQLGSSASYRDHLGTPYWDQILPPRPVAANMMPGVTARKNLTVAPARIVTPETRRHNSRELERSEAPKADKNVEL